MEIIRCLNCGKEFSKLLCQLTRGRGKYCSKQCYHDARYKGNDYKKIGKKRQHIIIAENIVGHVLPKNVQVHHYGGKEDNSKIIICQNQKYHKLIHSRTEAYQKTGDPNKRKCQFCKQWDDVKNLYIDPIRNKNIRHKKCVDIYNKSRTISTI
jgi:hypothetical protein